MPLDAVLDPFDLEVHRPITVEGVEGLPDLTPYVPRAHDHRLAEVVDRAAAGAGAIAVLVAESSAGKTRACWEALAPLRAAGGWRLWHPDPTRPDAVLRDLARVVPRTVVWLDEAQNHLGSPNGDRVAAALRALLAGRRPVLVLGTLWPQHHEALTREPGSPVRHLLDGAIVPVPDAFTDDDLAAMTRAARTDPRLAWAVRHAPDGRVTQQVAGGPELLTRFHTAPPAAKALITAAMDARRLGHRPALPLPLLAHAAAAHLADHQLADLPDDWLDLALAYATRAAKGAPGPLTRVVVRRTGRGAPGDGPPEYRLADYLDQWARDHRASHVPALDFWAAVADHARPDDQTALGRAAWNRGLYRDAARLHRRAAAAGDLTAARLLIEELRAVHPGDTRPARWLSAQDLQVDHTLASTLMTVLRRGGEDADELARRIAARVDLRDVEDVARALNALRVTGADDRVAALARDVAEHVPVDHPDVHVLLWSLWHSETHEQGRALGRRVAAHGSLHHAERIADLLTDLHEAGDTAEAAVLARRVGEADPPVHPADAIDLLGALQEVGAEEPLAALSRQVAAHTAVDDGFWATDLLVRLHQVGTAADVDTLADRIAATAPGDPVRTAYLLLALHHVGRPRQWAEVARRALGRLTAEHATSADWLVWALHEAGGIGLVAECATVDNPDVVVWLARTLREVAGPGHVAALAARAAGHTALDRADAVTRLLDALGELGLADEAAVLARRAAAEAALTPHYAIARLVATVRESDPDLAAALATRAAARSDLESTARVAILLRGLRTAGYAEAAGALAARAVAHDPLGSPFDLVDLAEALRDVGAVEQTAVLARRLIEAAGRPDTSARDAVNGLLDALWLVGAHDEFAALADRTAAGIDPGDHRVVVSLLRTLRDRGATRPLAVLARRVAADAPLDRAHVVTGLSGELRQVGAADEAAALAARAARHVAVDRPAEVVRLLDALADAGATEARAVLARRAAAQCPADSAASVLTLLPALGEEDADVLAGRAAARVELRPGSELTALVATLRGEHRHALAWRVARLRPPNGIVASALVEALRAAGCEDQAEALIDRLPAAGCFDDYLALVPDPTPFRHGREPDGTAAPPWSWTDLDRPPDPPRG
ncbi:hypothetical protein ACWEFJ_29955 [Actinosynnema sp. NPDC004786]